MVQTVRTQVLVVGGGTSGLTAALLLHRLGVDFLLVERRPGTALHPKAHVINQRSFEILTELGVAEDVYAASAPPEMMSTIVFSSSLAGRTPLHGRVIATTPAWSGGAEYFGASPVRPANLPQLRFEPILRRHAERRSPGRVRFGVELVDLEPGADGVTAVVCEVGSGTRYRVSADYLVAADGGRTVGERLGAELEGPRDLLEMVSAHFTADLSEYWPDDSVMINFSTNPDGEGLLGSGAILPLGPDTWGRKSTEWQYHSALRSGDPDEFDADRIVGRMRDMMGLPDLELTLNSLSRWSFEGTVANRYRWGRVFLVGDSAHRHPPNGGLGLNAAIADVHNLAWKLALVLRGRAGERLLDSYEAERRPVGQAVVERALANWRTHGGIDDALGLRAARTPAEGWRRLALYFSGTSEGERLRARVAGAVRAATREFTGQDIELGYRYRGGAVVGADLAGPVVPERFAKTTAPGATLPHAWLTGADGARVSTLDLVRRDRLVLLVGDGAAEWARAVASLPSAFADLVAIERIGHGGWLDGEGEWAACREVGADGAVLVRPDRHIAWRATSPTADASTRIAEALRAILDLPGGDRM